MFCVIWGLFVQCCTLSKRARVRGAIEGLNTGESLVAGIVLAYVSCGHSLESK
jgi:hypothetical protein